MTLEQSAASSHYYYTASRVKNRLVFLVDARIIEILWRMDVSLNERPKG